MKKWLRRVRGAAGMGLTWAVGWALVGGGLMEVLVDPHGRILDTWPQTLAIPGFLGGVTFSVVLRIAEGRRRFEELSLARFAVWGTVAGVLLGTLTLAAGVANGVFPPWLRAAVTIGPMAPLSAVAATGSLALARKAVERESIEARADVAAMGRAGGEAQDRLEDGG